MDEHSFMIRDGENVCAVTLTDIQGELAADAREQLLREFEQS